MANKRLQYARLERKKEVESSNNTD